VFGCLGRLGCLALILILAVIAFLTREWWEPRVFGERAATTVAWEPVTDTGVVRATEALEELRARSGPAYVDLTAAEVASLVASRGVLPPAVDSVQAAVEGDRILLRARIDLDDIRGLDVGPLTDMLNRRERFEASGTLEVIRPGLAQFVVATAQIGDLPIPQSMIPRVLDRLARRGQRPAGVARNGLAFPVPESIGDIRVSGGVVRLYRRTP
jgi:hypothetical protein